MDRAVNSPGSETDVRAPWKGGMNRNAIEAASMAMFAAMVLLGASLTSSGCDDGDPSDGDGDADSDGDGDADIEVEAPTAPEPPESPEAPRLPEEPAEPVLTPCPGGWREAPPDDSSDVTTCEPWPVSGPLECGDDEAHFPGEAGCVRIGTECPSGDWADDLPSDAEIVYVKAGAPAGGDGTMEFPFESITRAMFSSSPGAIIALSKGTFDEELAIFNNNTLWGACVAQTELTCSLPSDLSAAVTVLGSDVELRNLQVTGSRAGISVVGSSANAHLEDIMITECRSFGIGVMDGASARGRSIVVRKTVLDSDGSVGHGLDVIFGGIVGVERMALEGNQGSGVYASGEGTSVSLADLVIRDLPHDGIDGVGHGLVFRNGAQGAINRGVIDRTRGVGIWVLNAGTTLSLEDALVRDTQRSDALSFSRGMAVQDGAQVNVARSVFERNWNGEIYLDSEGSSVSLTDVVARDTLSDTPSNEGTGLSVFSGAHAELSRAIFDRNRSCAVYAEQEGSTLAMADVIVGNTQANTDVDGGRGMNLSDGANVDAERIVFGNNISTGIHAEGVGTSLALTDVTIRDTQPDSTVESGRGLNLQDGVEAIVNRGLFERNRDTAIFLSSDGTAATLTDVTVRETANDGLGEGGRGLNVQTGAHVEVERGTFEESGELGIFAGGDGTELALTDIVIRETLGCRNGEGGRGMNVETGALVAVTRALLENNREVGIWVGDEGTELTLEDVVVSDTQRNGLGEIGTGMEVKDGASADVTRAIFEGNHGAGIYAVDDGTMLTLDDVIIRDTQLDENGYLGRGIEAQGGANLWISRAILERNHTAGIAIFHEGTTLTLRSVVVRGTLCDASGEYGEGLAVLLGAAVESTRTAFEGNRTASVYANNEGTTLIMNHVSVVETLERECVHSTCPSRGAGHGVVARDNAHIDLTSFEILRSALCGVQVAFGGSLDLHDGVVADNLIGANVQTEEFDWDRLLDTVVFSDNERDFDSEQMPVPETGLPIEWNTE